MPFPFSISGSIRYPTADAGEAALAAVAATLARHPACAVTRTPGQLAFRHTGGSSPRSLTWPDLVSGGVLTLTLASGPEHPGPATLHYRLAIPATGMGIAVAIAALLIPYAPLIGRIPIALLVLAVLCGILYEAAAVGFRRVVAAARVLREEVPRGGPSRAA